MSPPFFALLNREIQRFLRVLGQTIFTPMINALLYLLIFGVSLGKYVEMGVDVPYLLFLIPGLIMMGVLQNSFQNSSSSIMISKYYGDLEDLKITPLTTHHIVWALSFSSLLRGLIVGITIALTGEIFSYLQNGHFFNIAHPFLMLFFLTIAGLAFAQLGIFIGFFAKTFDQLNSFGAVILLPLIYLGGVFFRLEHLHPFWRTVSLGNPLVYYINGVRYAVIQFSDVPVSTCAIAGMLFLAVCSALAYLSVKKGGYQRF